MPIYDLYSRRKKQTEQTQPDIFQYTQIPEALRVQIQLIWDGAIGPDYQPSGYGMERAPQHNNIAWEFIRNAMCREMGRHTLAGASRKKGDCFAFLHREQNIDDLLNLIEFSFTYIDRVMGQKGDYDRARFGATQDPDDAIEELNFRFRQAGVGYQYANGQIIRVDSELLHSDVVLPALHLLSDPRFSGPEDEFLAAHAHYRAGEYKDCVADALNAFESTMKTICETQRWDYKNGARASDLLKVLRANSLLPDYLDKSFDQLVANLSSGLPTVRNEEGAHGQGSEPKATPSYIAAYALHLAAAKIVLLVEAMDGDA